MLWHVLSQHLASILGLVLGVLLVSRVLGQRESPSVTVAWLLLILFIPWLGAPLYLMFGTRKMRRTMVRKQPLFVARPRTGRDADDTYGIDATLRTAGQPPLRTGHRVEIAVDGQDAWRRLLAAIDGATSSIWLCTFILKADEVGQAVVDALARRAADGIDVRVLVDGLGSWRTRRRFVAPIRKAGGEVAVFLPVQPLARPWSANLRNHRKSLVVDQRVAFVGGMNVGATYFGPKPDARQWIDTLVEIEGPVVADIADVFRRDWTFAADRALEPLPAPPAGPVPGHHAPARIVANGPDTPDDPYRDVLLLSMVGARKRVWIVTPYFVPDETLLQALLVTARQGADVRLVLPGSSDHFLADLARGHALRMLAEAGVRIFLHPDRMVHAKLCLFDDELAIVGSANLDRRSLFLNHEISLLLLGRAEVDDLRAWTERLMGDCEQHTPKPGHALRLFAEDVTGILAPLI